MRRSKTRFPATALVFAFTALAANPIGIAGAKSDKTKSGKTIALRTARVPGAAVEFKTKKLKKGAKETAELQAMLTAGATLKVEKPFSYGRSSLPSGAYPVKVQQTEEEKWYFVVGEKPPEKPRRDKGKEEKSGADAMGIAGKPDLQRPQGVAKEKKESSSPRRGRKRGAKQNDEDKNDEGKNDESQDTDKPAKATGWLRARIRFSKVAEPKSEVIFDLRSLDRGARLELSVRAGATQGKATFRIIDRGEEDE